MKVYIKSATNISDLEAKIAKKQADIDKKTAWIQKVNARIAKKMNKLSSILAPEDLARVQKKIDLLSTNNRYSSKFQLPEECSTDFLTKKYNWDWGDENKEIVYSLADDASSIYNSNEAIKEAQAVIDSYEAKISALKDKASEIDRIPDCLKTFLDDIVSRWDEHDFRIKNEGKPYYWDLYNKAWKILYGDTSSGIGSVAKAKLAELYPDVPEDSYRDTRRRKFDDEYINIPFERKYGSLKYARSIWDLTEEKIHANNQRDGENLILDLLRRVTKITGPVTDWSELYVTQGNMGAVINGYVIGEDGRAEVESILAGGYNIQRLHVRTLVKPIR